MTKNGLRERGRGGRIASLFLDSVFLSLSLSLSALLRFFLLPPNWPGPLWCFCDKRLPEMCFIAWSACKATPSISLARPVFKKCWLFLTSRPSIRLSFHSSRPRRPLRLCFVLFTLFCGQSRNRELIISGSIPGFSFAPSLGGINRGRSVALWWQWLHWGRGKEGQVIHKHGPAWDSMGRRACPCSILILSWSLRVWVTVLA